MSLWNLVITAVAVLLLTIVAGYLLLPRLRRLKVGQEVRDDGPRTHLGKSGTPTFGGLFFVIPIFIAGLIWWIGIEDGHVFGIIALFMFIIGAIGFWDDYTKVRITKDGLSVMQKTALLVIAITAFIIWYLWLAPTEPFLWIPFSGKIVFIKGAWKFLYALFLLPFIFFVNNAVNIADGVDGLCSSVTVITMLALQFGLAFAKTAIPHADGMRAATVAIAAGCLGFLYFNRHPAKVFMGDLGSLALGAGLSAITVIAGIPYLVVFFGIIYIIDALSVVLQVTYFKATGGKRIFKMAPLHHHFELSGWSETKVVTIFSLIALIGGLVGIVFMTV